MFWLSADFSGGFWLKGKLRKSFDIIVSTKSMFFLILIFLGRGLQPPRLGALLTLYVLNRGLELISECVS